jgi:hypothetical protein
MPVVKGGGSAALSNRDIEAQCAFSIDAPVLVAEYASKTAARIDPAGKAIVRTADKRSTVLHCPEEC